MWIAADEGGGGRIVKVPAAACLSFQEQNLIVAKSPSTSCVCGGEMAVETTLSITTGSFHIGAQSVMLTQKLTSIWSLDLLS